MHNQVLFHLNGRYFVDAFFSRCCWCRCASNCWLLFEFDGDVETVMTKITWWKLFRWRLESHSEQRVITTTTAKTYAHSYNNKKSQNFFSRFRNLIFFLPLYSHLNFFQPVFSCFREILLDDEILFQTLILLFYTYTHTVQTDSSNCISPEMFLHQFWFNFISHTKNVHNNLQNNMQTNINEYRTFSLRCFYVAKFHVWWKKMNRNEGQATNC